MRYAVLYQSNTGNTEKIAHAILDAIETEEEKFIINLCENDHIPEADVYFIGFAVYNQSCSLNVMECLSRITEGKIALFATCGFYPTDKYAGQIENTVTAWLNDGIDYLGMYLCQGRVAERQQAQFMEAGVQIRDALHEMFHEGSRHPDEKDTEKARSFAMEMIGC